MSLFIPDTLFILSLVWNKCSYSTFLLLNVSMEYISKCIFILLIFTYAYLYLKRVSCKKNNVVCSCLFIQHDISMFGQLNVIIDMAGLNLPPVWFLPFAPFFLSPLTFLPSFSLSIFMILLISSIDLLCISFSYFLLSTHS